MHILVVNCGSSSLKLRLLDDSDTVVEQADLPEDVDPDELGDLLRGWRPPDVIGHRVVHGGATFTGAVRLDGTVRRQLEDLTDLAPLHQPRTLAAIDVVGNQLPGVPAVACFDTAFHAAMPAAAATYAVPRQWRERYGLRRFGFHGLSHAYAARRAAQLLGRPLQELRMVTCHLGAGASLAAILDGRSVDTTMGFTPLDGLVMATRSGAVDPGLVLWLQEHARLSASEVSEGLEKHSGLTALAGTGDIREVEAAADRSDPAATLALDVYIHRLVRGIAAMAAATGGLDALVFTGGVGENSASIRSRTVARLGLLGAAVDPEANSGAGGDRDVSAGEPSARTVVVSAREDLQITREIRRLLGLPAADG